MTGVQTCALPILRGAFGIIITKNSSAELDRLLRDRSVAIAVHLAVPDAFLKLAPIGPVVALAEAVLVPRLTTHGVTFSSIRTHFGFARIVAIRHSWAP